MEGGERRRSQFAVDRHSGAGNGRIATRGRRRQAPQNQMAAYAQAARQSEERLPMIRWCVGLFKLGRWYWTEFWRETRENEARGCTCRFNSMAGHLGLCVPCPLGSEHARHSAG